ncbi:hypothetical protein OOK31_03615 [Streptomyces sp. NBC_00249]|uniref:hypothetical protein n=1 Tax=Streptomyces sp. NBC_00249 TaxID=2975690 RepID=UPI00225B3A3E|nr:hypothetical protein [Streptomyces sp. NBC_00249]MCX5192988.1 hypothetical protein [Streptomyces sp. NBC_00249]
MWWSGGEGGLEELARAVVNGGPVPGPDTGPGRDAGADYLTAWAEDSFVGGLHLALRCGSLLLACTLVLVLALLSRRRP